MNKKALKFLKEIAAIQAEDLECATSGGNLDDAYWGGYNAGEIELARKVLDILGESWIQ